MTTPRRSRRLTDAAWAMGFGVIAGLAALWSEGVGHGLAGGITITLLTQPRALLLLMGGPDIAGRSAATVAGAVILTILLSLPFLVGASPAGERRRRIPPVAITLAILLVVESVYFVTGDVPREMFRGPTLG